MRIVALLPCLLLAACLAYGNQPAPEASAVAATPAPDTSATAAKPSPTGIRDALTQARFDCWMKVEHESRIRDIDRRIAFVDKCVANAMKGNP